MFLKTQILYFFLIIPFIQNTPEKLNLSETILSAEIKKDFNDKQPQNSFLINLEDFKIIKKKNFFIIFESENPGFTISFYNSNIANTNSDTSIILDIITYSGNMVLAMSDSFFNTKFLFFKNTGQLLFKIKNDSGIGKGEYKIKVLVAERLKLDIDRVYTTRIDYMISNLGVDFEYKAEDFDFEKINKIRFQLTSVMYKEKYSMSAKLEDSSTIYKMNNIFQNIVGGILEDSSNPICKTGTCLYKLEIFLINLKVINIETFLIPKIEDLTILHYDDYYDRVYKTNKSQFYRLKYNEQMKNLDISISLIPVNGNTNLFINPKTKPKELESYYYKQKGNLSKRITVKNSDLVQMKAEGSDLYIAVFSEKAGEFMLRLDAHDDGYRGRLSSGILESGFVKDKEIANYLYSFEVYRTQEISFDVKLNVISGDADLYLKKCETLIDCRVETVDGFLEDPDLIVKKESDHVLKEINHGFECKAVKKHKLSHCRFLIVVVGKEDRGSHYEISLQENRFHRLILPGYLMNLSLLPMEKKYVKLSFPSLKNENSELFLSIENIWGSFTIYIDKKDKFPGPEAYRLKHDFHSQKAGLYKSLKEIKINPQDFQDQTLQGTYYITIESLTSTSLNLKFYEKTENKLTIHTLSAGQQQKAKITNNKEIIYYTIKVSLSSKKANSVIVDLNPLKGRFIIFASRSGYLPTKIRNDIISNDHSLELFYKNYDEEDEEYIIGVQSAENDDYGDSSQFSIFLSYSNKFLKLNPGVLSSHTIHDKEKQNLFLIEILQDMQNILIVKSIIDGYNLKLCLKFGEEENSIVKSECDENMDEQKVGLFYEKKEIDKFCKKQIKDKKKCFLQILVEGYSNQKFSIGFTYNNMPFEIVKETVINGPIVQSEGYKINFIHHAEIGKPINFYFNAKGHKVRILSKIVNSDDFDTKLSLTFPSIADYDENNITTEGHVSLIYYDATTVQSFGENPEVLLSVIPILTKRIKPITHQEDVSSDESVKEFEDEKIFKKQGTFIFQSSLKTQEIIRTHTHTQFIYEQNYEYFNFYNNGLSDKLTIYINSNDASFLEVVVSKNRFARPPHDTQPIKKINGINSIILEFSKDDLKTIKNDDTSMKGYYTIGVKSNISTTIHIYWNNKDTLDYMELTPSITTVTSVQKDKMMFLTFYAESENKKEGKIIIHLKSDVKTEFFVLTSKNNKLRIPGEDNYSYKKIMGDNGGITNVEIEPSDQDYCIECTYIIYAKVFENAQISVLVNIENQENPITIKSGLPIYDYLSPNKTRKYRFLNTDKEKIFMCISMLSGYVNIYFDSEKDVSVNKFKNKYFLDHDLDVHKYIEINKKTYGLDFDKNLYFLVENAKSESASFMLNVYQHGVIIPIEKGVTKYFGLGKNDEVGFFFEKKNNEKDFEIVFKLRKIVEKKRLEDVLKGLGDMVKIYLMSNGKDNVEIQIKNKYLNDNTLYIEFELTQNENQKFKINIKNKYDTILGLSIDLLIDNYKLLHVNEPLIDYITTENSKKIYEFISEKDKFIYISLQSCFGRENIQISETYEKIISSETPAKLKYKTIKDIDSNLHYLKTKTKNTFLSITNKGGKNIYKIIIYNQSSMDDNPYNEFEGGNKGKVEINTQKNKVNFKGIEIQKIGTSNFIHKIIYRVYLSPNFKVMKFLKNCGSHRIEKAFDKADFSVFEKVVILENDDIEENLKDVEIQFNNLEVNKKYYGIVIADVNLLPRNFSIEPVRFSKIYYDEFIFKSSRMFFFDLYYLAVLVVLFGFFFGIIVIVKIYIFGGVGNLNVFKGFLDFRGLKKDCLNENVKKILESKLEGYKKNVGNFDLDKKEFEMDEVKK